MSWLLGFIGEGLSRELQERLAPLHGPASRRFAGQSVYMAVGGPPETCLWGTAGSRDEHWAVLGVGLRRRGDRSVYVNAGDWKARLTSRRPRLGEMDGHFVAVRWDSRRIEAYTDILGVRPLYVTQLAEGSAISTRLDWLATLRGGGEIDLGVFGAQWLTFNQLSTDSLLKHVTRVGPSGHLVLSPEETSLSEQLWTPNTEHVDETDLATTIGAFVHPTLPRGRRLSLGLSGGLDSRLLLALRREEEGFTTHVFGRRGHPDVEASLAIAAGERIPHAHFSMQVPDADACLSLLREHHVRTHTVSPASAVVDLRYFPELRAQHKEVIDGGFGEILRRQFMNRLRLRGRRALDSGDPAAIFPYLRVSRADVFAPEADAAMEAGALRQIEMVWQSLPDIGSFGHENFLDLLAVRTRLPNFFGFEQERLDGILRAFMPFAQPSVLHAVFSTPPARRRSGALARRLIRTFGPGLTRYPLVKGRQTYPFALPGAMVPVWTSAASFVRRSSPETGRNDFLRMLAPFIQDTLHSEHLRSYAPYDHGKLTRLIEAYFGGQEGLAGAVDWWLSFEMWRQSV